MTPTTSRALAARLEKHENAAAKAVRTQETKMATKPAFETITLTEHAVIEVTRMAQGMNEEETIAMLTVGGEWKAQVKGRRSFGYWFHLTKMSRDGKPMVDYLSGRIYKSEAGALKRMIEFGKRRAADYAAMMRDMSDDESDVQS